MVWLRRLVFCLVVSIILIVLVFLKEADEPHLHEVQQTVSYVPSEVTVHEWYIDVELLQIPSPTATIEPRTNCESIRGTEYVDESEREFFLANCIIVEPTPRVDTSSSTQQRSGSAIQWDTQALRDLICSYDWDCGWAIATAICESSLNPNAIGSEIYNGVRLYFVGLFQVLGGSTDPVTNIEQALVQYKQWQAGQRARPWPNCP